MKSDAATRQAEGLQVLTDAYDLFLVDQFGVLHDGTAPYPGAVAALEALKARGKTTIMLTNSGKRSAPNLARVLRLGFPEDALSAVVSSGEVAWQAISRGTLGRPFVADARVFVVGRPGADYGLDGLLRLQEDPADADFLLISASDAPAIDLGGYADLLEPAAAQQIPALCSNPDKVMIQPSGLQPGSGAIADVYASLGGTVLHVGKPYPAIYEAARALAGDVPAERTVVVGDSIEHDIHGGANAGLATILVRTGILATATDAELDALCERHEAWPDHVLPSLRWA